MKNSDDSDFDVSRGELFEAISHPTRIKIIQVLGEKPMGFSELKRSVGIESGGLLSFHLRKLEQLASMTEKGVYALTDQGKEALRMISVTRGEPGGQTVRVSPANKRRYLAIILVLLLVLASVSAVAVYQHYSLAGPTNTTSSPSLPTKTSSVENVANVTVTGFLLFNSSGIPAQRTEWVNITTESGKTYGAVVDPAGQYWITLPNNNVITVISASWRSLVPCFQNCVIPALGAWPTNSSNVTCSTKGFCTLPSETTTSTCQPYALCPSNVSFWIAWAGYTNESNYTGYAIGGCVADVSLGEFGMTVLVVPVVIENLTCP